MGSLGGVHLPADGEVGGEERPLEARAGAAVVRDRRCEAALALRRDLRHGQGSLTPQAIANIVKINFDCRPGAIAKSLQLREPKYQITAAYGHFGRAPYTENGMKFFEWENASDLSKFSVMTPDAVDGELK